MTPKNGQTDELMEILEEARKYGICAASPLTSKNHCGVCSGKLAEAHAAITRYMNKRFDLACKRMRDEAYAQRLFDEKTNNSYLWLSGVLYALEAGARLHGKDK